MKAIRRRSAAFLLPFILAALCGVSASSLAGQNLPLSHWAYQDVERLYDAGLLPDYPADAIRAGHPLTRNELAFYLRGLLVQDDSRLILNEDLSAALGRLVVEFTLELRALGVDIESMTRSAGTPIFIDLEDLLRLIAYRPEPPPAAPPPSPLAGVKPSSDAGKSAPAQKENPIHAVPAPNISLNIPASDFKRGNPFILAGEVLGISWNWNAGESATALNGLGLRIGQIVIADYRTDPRGSLALNLGGLGLGFNALWYLDLDQAQKVVDRFLIGVHTELDSVRRLNLFGGLSLTLRPGATATPDVEAAAGLQLALGRNLHLLAEYSFAKPSPLDAAQRQGASIGIGLGDIGMILLGLQSIGIDRFDRLEIKGTFIYRF